MNNPRRPSAAADGGVVPLDERLAETKEANDALLASAMRAQEDARAAADVRAQLEALISGLAEGVVVVNGAAGLLFANPAARQLLNLVHADGGPSQAPELVCQRLDGAPISPDENPVTRAAQGERFADVELLALAAGGKRRCQFSGNSVLDRAGDVVMAIVTMRDVTELRQLEQLREEYLALVSHDLRSPLALVLGAADRLARAGGGETNSERAELVSLIKAGADRMNDMIGQLMRAASLESGQVVLEREPIVMARLARAMVEECASEGPTRHTEVAVGADVPPVLADRALMEHALSNLITNAVKYSDPGTPISTRVERDGDEVVVSVSDQGRGIASEAQPFIFDRLFRANTNAGTSGYGLGLYVVRLIVEAHGGRIWVDSQPGMGSTFTFTLPIGDITEE